MSSLTFSEVEIQGLFGHEAAEDEDIARLRSYYFKSSTYDQIVTDLPLRILVGHKGIGKSALFQVAMSEDKDNNRLAVLIKPDDVLHLAISQNDFLSTTREWKEGISEIIAAKVLTYVGSDTGDLKTRLSKFGGKALVFLRDSLSQASFNYNPAHKFLVEQFLRTNRIIVYVDDLDRGWQGGKVDISRISALLNAVRDLARDNPGLHFRISLRSDVYFLVRTSDESTDKIEGSVIWQSWTNYEILALLIKRIEAFFGRVVSEEELLKKTPPVLARYLDPIMQDRFLGAGHWANAPMDRVIMSLIRKRPRDLVKLCSLAARNARVTKASRIQTENFTNIFEEYSQGRLQDTINEFRSELSNIDRLLMNMKPDKVERQAKLGYVYTTGDLITKISKIRNLCNFSFTNGRPVTDKSLAAFMYKINFLTARKETEKGIVRKYFEESRYLSSEFVDFGFAWEVHPAYRWALQPDNLKDMYTTLELTSAE